MFSEYILGYDFTESLIVFSPKQIIFFVASKKKMLLEKVNRPAGIQCPPIKIMLRNTEGGNEKTLEEIMTSIVKDCGKEKTHRISDFLFLAFRHSVKNL